MKTLLLAAILALSIQSAEAQSTLPTPGFHHLHLNSVDPAAAIAFYTREFPTTMPSSFAGLPALKTGPVYVLFAKVNSPPPTTPQTALWHFGWHVVDVHQSLTTYQQRPEVHLLPLYTTDEGGSVFVSSDTWPGTGGSLGLTKPQIAEAKAKGVQPTHGAGFGYIAGPDGAIIEYQGNMPAERFNHVHLFQRDPFCAQLWYEVHLNAGDPAKSPYTMANCKVPVPERSWPSLEVGGMLRQPATVTFGDVSITWHVQQDDRPLVSSVGHLYDHFALSVVDLDAWVAKLRRENVKFLKTSYKVGDARALMIEGPSREAIELIEIK